MRGEREKGRPGAPARSAFDHILRDFLEKNGSEFSAAFGTCVWPSRAVRSIIVKKKNKKKKKKKKRETNEKGGKKNKRNRSIFPLARNDDSQLFHSF